MKRNAFTLIELLAVIVILAIIALIAVPSALRIIEDSKKSSEKDSVRIYLKQVQSALTKENLNTAYNPTLCDIQRNGNIKYFNEEIELDEIVVDIRGDKPTAGTIRIENGKVVFANNIMFSDKKYNYEDGKILELDNNTNNNENSEISEVPEAEENDDAILLHIDNEEKRIPVSKEENIDFKVTGTGLDYKLHSESEYKTAWTYSGNDVFKGFSSYTTCGSTFSVDKNTSQLNLNTVTTTMDLSIISKYGDRIFMVDRNSFNSQYEIDLDDVQLKWYDSSNKFLTEGLYYTSGDGTTLNYDITLTKKKIYLKEDCSSYAIDIILYESQNISS